MILKEERKSIVGVLLLFLKKNPMATLGALIILISTLAVLLAPILPISDPLFQDLANRLKPPSRECLFGTDQFGRDVLSRIIWGGRISLLVGTASVGLGLLIGVVLGLISGYFGKMVDAVIMRIADIILSFPALLLAIAICAAIGSELWNVVIALAIVGVPRFTRLVRGSTLSVKEEDFVEAARALGQSQVKIILFHILPNVLSPILVFATLWLPFCIVTEAGLSFLGLGVMPPTATWGNMINEGKGFLYSAPWISVFSGIAISVVVLAFNFVGDAMRDVLDPRLKGEREAEGKWKGGD
jgi:peptide/nickel transport system permease protein